MDKRIKLTAKQLTLVKRLKELLTKMEKEQIGVIYYESFSNLSFYNKSNVIDTDSGWGVGNDCGEWYVQDGKVWISPDFEDFNETDITIPIDITLDSDEDWLVFAVEPSTKEELEALAEQDQGKNHN
jgi:hypothetical protein